MTPLCQFRPLGLAPYQAAWELQNSLAAAIAAGDLPPTLLLLEHPHTFTFGRKGQIKNLLWDEAELGRRGVTVHWVDRGGDVTYHGPGQLVGYPLLPLGSLEPRSDSGRLPQADYVGYLRRLEETLIIALSRLGVQAQQVEGMTGIWVEGRAKLAAIGVKVDVHGVTRHGFALNVDPEMSYWEGIIACGLVGYPVTSLRQVLGQVPSMQAVTDAVVRAFGEVFGYDMQLFVA